MNRNITDDDETFSKRLVETMKTPRVQKLEAENRRLREMLKDLLDSYELDGFVDVHAGRTLLGDKK